MTLDSHTFLSHPDQPMRMIIQFKDFLRSHNLTGIILNGKYVAVRCSDKCIVGRIRHSGEHREFIKFKRPIKFKQQGK